MGLFSNLFHGFYYVVDSEMLKKHLSSELNYSLENQLEASANLNIYFNNEKHHIQIWNHAASSFDDEKAKGVIFYYDDEEFKQLDELFNAKLADLPGYFKIELIDSDSEDLKEYKNSHPELKVEDY